MTAALILAALLAPSALVNIAERVAWELAPRHPHLYRFFDEGDQP